jgi:Anti-sigma-K factor rskA
VGALRRTGWLTVLGAAAAGTYVASRARSQPRRALALDGPRVASVDEPDVMVTPEAAAEPAVTEMAEPARAAEPAAATAEAPTGAVTMVPVTMEATAAAPALRGPDHNGSTPAVPEPGATTARERIARPVELPPARRPTAAVLGGLAAVAGAAAVALGVLAVVSDIYGNNPDAGAVAAESQQAIGLLSRPGTVRIPLEGSGGSVVLAVASGARGVLVLDGLAPAPSGKAYEAWVVGPGETVPTPAAVFSGSETMVSLSRPVPLGATVGITVESSVGVDAPTQRLRFAAQRST